MRVSAILILGVIVVSLSGCGDRGGSSSVDATTPAGGEFYQLTGTVSNQFGTAAEGLYIVVSDSASYVDSVMTNTAGEFTLPNVLEGTVTITARSSEVAGYDHLRYLPYDDSITVDRDTSLDLTVREYALLFEDHGQGAAYWDLHGGVSFDGSTYVFTDSLLQKDYMEFSSALAVPAELDSLYLLVSGWAAPADSGIIWGTFIDTSGPLGLTYAVFYLTPETKVFPVHRIAGIIGSQVILELEQIALYNPQPHPEVTAMINEVVIFGY